MENASSKQIETTGCRSPQVKVLNLPLLCVEAIYKLTPTSKLAQLYSNAVPLPGANWNLGLEAVLNKRLPLSLANDLSHNQSAATRVDALFDSSGANVATVNHPEALQFSPLCEFVESAPVPYRVMPVCAAAEPHLRFVISGQPLLPHLPNIRKLTLIGMHEEPLPSNHSDGPELLIPTLKKVLPQLESFVVDRWHEESERLEAILVEMLPEMAALKHLDIYLPTFPSLVPAANGVSKDSADIRPILAGLTSAQLRYIFYDGSARKAPQVLSFLSDCCTQLTHLAVTINGQFKPHLTALRAFLSLNTLGLEIENVNTKGMSFNEDEGVHSVLDLRLVYNSLNQSSTAEKVAIASLFPNVRTARLYFEPFAVDLCEKKVWPKLAKLSCFDRFCGEDAFLIAQFLTCTNLPHIVDLSEVTEECLSRNSNVLTAIYTAVQRGPVKSLLLRGPMHRAALPRLQTHIDLNGENAKVTAWKDRDLGEQMSDILTGPVSEQTDLRIVGSKENGGDFAIRVVHQFAKKTEIFD